MTRRPNALIATDKVSDAGLVERMLHGEVGSVTASTVETDAVADFERSLPDVLILAFDSLEKAERYYLGLFRLSSRIHQQRHRTLVLCNKDEVKRAFELCRKGYFDDYILFWPMTHDTSRLAMGIHHAWRELTADDESRLGLPALAAQARRMDGLESFLERNLIQGSDKVESVRQSLGHLEDALSEPFNRFAHSVLDGGLAGAQVTDVGVWNQELARLKMDVIAHQQNAASNALQSLEHWVRELREGAAPLVQSARTLKSMLGELRPVVLIVEDDPLQRKILTKVLGQEWFELALAATGIEALTLLKRLQPDLILMDLMLPDLDGREVTKRVKSMPRFQSVPIIMITGRSDKDNVINSLRAGAADFVVKPFDRTILLDKVRHFLGAAAPAALQWESSEQA
jgi:CheY-like chemotaxis protein